MTLIVSLEELKTNNWIAIHGRVYDIHAFDDHPGGKDIILALAGKDATLDFEDIGHSDSARRQASNFFVGFLGPSEGLKKELPSVSEVSDSKSSSGGLSTGTVVLSGMVVLAGAIAEYFAIKP